MAKDKLDRIGESLRTLATPLSDLSSAPDNVRNHDNRSVDSIAASLNAYGQQKPIVALSNGTVIAGNGTLTAAKKLGWSHLAVARFKGSKDEAKAFAIADNRTADLSDFNQDALADALAYLEGVPGISLDDMGYTDREFMALVGDLEGEAEKASADVSSGKGSDTDYEEGDFEDEDDGADAPASHVRMVQLFLNESNHPGFVEDCQALSGKYGTANVTDTVLRAIETAVKHDL